MMQIQPATIRQFATFHVDDLLLGIDVMNVQEVLHHQPITPVPLAPPVVEGLINLRGQIIIALDLRRALGLRTPPPQTLPMNAVIQSAEGVVSLLVDRIGDVIDVLPADYAALPENVPEEHKRTIAGVYHLKQGLMLVLDTASILENSCA